MATSAPFATRRCRDLSMPSTSHALARHTVLPSRTCAASCIPSKVPLIDSFETVVLHSEAAASTIPAALKAFELVISTETGYFHSMNLPQPQYAHFRPKYLPTYGIKTSVNNNSSCCKLSLHSRSASEYASSSLGETEVVEPADDDGRESTSSGVGMFAYDEDGSDMVATICSENGGRSSASRSE